MSKPQFNQFLLDEYYMRSEDRTQVLWLSRQALSQLYSPWPSKSLTKGKKSSCKIMLMLNLGSDVQTLILYTVETLNVLFSEDGFVLLFLME